MPFFKRAKYDDPAPGGNNALIPFAVAFALLILLTFSALTHLPLIIESMFIPVQHPLIYKFPQYSALLPKIVKGDYVDYKFIKTTDLLKEAVADLARTSPDDLEDDSQRFCFWINSYNMLVLRAIMEKYPIERLDEKRLTRSFSADKYFVGGKPYSLEEIKRMQLLPRVRTKPTTLFLICNGSLGGPPLLDHLITPQTLAADAEAAARKFVLKKGNAEYDPDHKTFVLSPLFKWNEDVFSEYGGPTSFANKLRPKDAQLDLSSMDVLFKSYARNFNWYLNDAALQKSAEPKDEKAAETTTK